MGPGGAGGGGGALRAGAGFGGGRLPHPPPPLSDCCSLTVRCTRMILSLSHVHAMLFSCPLCVVWCKGALHSLYTSVSVVSGKNPVNKENEREEGNSETEAERRDAKRKKKTK